MISPDISKWCTRCNKWSDHWASDCPTENMLDRWTGLSFGNAFWYESHKECVTHCIRESE
jgi:hypothetical protein